MVCGGNGGSGVKSGIKICFTEGRGGVWKSS